jgi:hypothetical protein
MDIFRDYFTREALLGSIAKVQYVPGKFAPWFESRSLNGTIFALESVPIQGYNILSESPRGTPSKVETLVRRDVHTFNTKHYRADGAVYADEVLNMRGLGITNAVDVIQQRRDETMAKLRRDIDMTHELLRLNTILTPDNAFGSKPVAQTIAFGTDATKTRAEILSKVIKPMESALDGIPFSGLHAYVEDTGWAKIIDNKEIKDTLIYHSMATSLRGDPREAGDVGTVSWLRIDCDYYEYRDCPAGRRSTDVHAGVCSGGYLGYRRNGQHGHAVLPTGDSKCRQSALVHGDSDQLCDGLHSSIGRADDYHQLSMTHGKV